jgi:hypothetical protein
MLFDALLVMPKNSPINGHFALFVCEVPHTRWKNKALEPELGGVVRENEMADSRNSAC